MRWHWWVDEACAKVRHHQAEGSCLIRPRSLCCCVQIVVKTFQHVADHLRLQFCSEDWKEKHKVGSAFVINEVQVLDADSKAIQRDEAEVYDSVVGIRKSFGYQAVSTGRVLQRWFDCWCTACMAATGPGAGMDGAAQGRGYRVQGCTKAAAEPWWDQTVQLQGARGIRRQHRLNQKRGRELAASLLPDTFVVVKDRTTQGNEEPFLVGITRACNGDSCIKREIQERETIDGTRYDPGDYAIAVQWLARVAEDPEQRIFELVEGGEHFLINSTELRFGGVGLELVPPLGPAVRRSSRGLTRAQSSGGRVLPRKYVLPIESEQAILDCL